jgi:ribosomal protein L2
VIGESKNYAVGRTITYTPQMSDNVAWLAAHPLNELYIYAPSGVNVSASVQEGIDTNVLTLLQVPTS